jgi:hypothetical protein
MRSGRPAKFFRRLEAVYAICGRANPISNDRDPAAHDITNATTLPRPGLNPVKPALNPTVEITRCLLRLANLPSFALDCLSRYGAALWRQVRQVLFALDAFDQERRCRSRVDDRPELPTSDSDDC